eukprot:9989374-Heterocapsa_arctica.AAC.1
MSNRGRRTRQGGLADQWDECMVSLGRGCYPLHHTGRVAYNPQLEVVAPGIGRAASGVVMTCVRM